jgi:hypothetical protein
MQPPTLHINLIDRLTRPARNVVSAAMSSLGGHSRKAESSPRPSEGWGADRRQRDRRNQERRRDEATLLDAHGSMRAGNPNRCLRVLVEWQSSRGDTAEDFAWVCSRIASWDDARLCSHLTQERVSRLLALKRYDETLELMIRKLTAEPQFRPKTSRETLGVAQLATKSGHTRLARALLSDFAARFKGDARIPAAYALKQRLSAPSVQEKSA